VKICLVERKVESRKKTMINMILIAADFVIADWHVRINSSLTLNSIYWTKVFGAKLRFCFLSTHTRTQKQCLI